MTRIATDSKRRARRPRLLASLACLLLASPMLARGPEFPVVFVQEALQAGSLPAARLVRLDPDGRATVLTDGFAAAADPAVSHDGQRLLFAARLRPDDDWSIWEMAADGSDKRRLTRDMGDCREPAYLAHGAVDAPNFRDKVPWMTFTSTAPAALDERGAGPLTSLYAMTLDPVPGRGTVTWRTTYNLGGDLAPTVLRDGRVLFSAWQRAGYALMTISWAGENLNPFYGSHDGPRSQLSACELPEKRLVVFVESEAPRAERAGPLVAVSLRRPLHSRRRLSPEGERYRTPHWAPDSRLLVASRGKAGDTFGIFYFDLDKGRRGRRLYDDPDWHDVDALPLVARTEPVGRIPMVAFASVLNVGGFQDLGQLQCMNVYDSDRPAYAGLAKGSVASVRLVEGVPFPLPGRTGPWPGSPTPTTDADAPWPPPYVTTRSLGEAPVEADGSFYVNVSGDVPFYVETLDENGQVVQTMRSWVWVRSGDQRGCIGCHENKELAPENRVTEALGKARPLTLNGSSTHDR